MSKEHYYVDKEYQEKREKLWKWFERFMERHVQNMYMQRKQEMRSTDKRYGKNERETLTWNGTAETSGGIVSMLLSPKLAWPSSDGLYAGGGLSVKDVFV